MDLYEDDGLPWRTVFVLDYGIPDSTPGRAAARMEIFNGTMHSRRCILPTGQESWAGIEMAIPRIIRLET
ncbi:hypothetical protein FA13DRAFT_1726892 [Coprinellus micaceus]|jgi:hypothetical protein|uniref:Uncharacterized protein n=1 Tax=Coprinellus micaceus TaxID=71717 RepID=A0A4Y7TQS0_COPMI|nr:hypothetical protein FA13DRAFT_1726892 [Coprinellus micaceus]